MTRRARSRTAAPLLALSLALTPLLAVETRLVQEGPATLTAGEAEGVALSQRGRMFLAPRLERIGAEGWEQAPAHVWSVARDGSGNVYLGTGPDGRIFKITPSGKRSLLYAVDEPMVTALAIAPGGGLLAGTAPEGKVYRIEPDGTGAPWAETGERYVWSLAVVDRNRVYAGTGDNGRIVELDRSGKVSDFFDAGEAHVVSLLPLPGGGLLAGGAGRGLLYQIDEEGHGHVLHDDDLPEVTAIALLPDGDVVIGLLAAPPADPQQPLVRIQLPGGTRSPGGDAVRDLDEQGTAVIEGAIEGLTTPGRGERRSKGVRGRVVRVAADGAVEELWRSNRDAPYSLALDDRGRVLFGTGEPARIYRAEPDGDVALLATLREAQVTGLVDAGGWIAVATSNPAAAYRMDGRAVDSGLFLSRPIDAGGQARWGSIRWREEGDPGRVELYTRTGNSAVPDATWSAWSPMLTSAIGSPIVNPDGRFLQWRARLSARHSSRSGASAVRVTYTPYNRAPTVASLDLDADGDADAVSGEAEFRFRCSDPDGDAVVVHLQYRRPGETEWSDAATSEPVESWESGPRSWNDGSVTWDTSGVEEGTYEVRATASDQVANHPGRGKRAFADSQPEITVDRTPPVLVVERRADGGAEVVVTDAHSWVRRLEFVRGERVRFSAIPVDGVADSPEERFLVGGGSLDGDGWIVRAADAAGNTAEEPLGP